MTKPLCVNVKRFENASEIGGLTPEPASVNALHHSQSALHHKFSITSPVSVNVPHHDQNAHDLKCSILGHVNASVLEF